MFYCRISAFAFGQKEARGNSSIFIQCKELDLVLIELPKVSARAVQDFVRKWRFEEVLIKRAALAIFRRTLRYFRIVWFDEVAHSLILRFRFYFNLSFS